MTNELHIILLFYLFMLMSVWDWMNSLKYLVVGNKAVKQTINYKYYTY